MASTAHQRHAFNVAQLRELARLIEKRISKGTHFALVLFDQEIIGREIVRLDGSSRGKSTAGYSTYVSNAERKSMVAALRECAAQLELEMDVPGVAPASSSTVN